MSKIIGSKRRVWALSLLIVSLVIFSVYQHYYRAGLIDMLSVSSDGKYAISTDEKEMAILWDLEHHSKKIISRKAHIFSAYFLPNSDNFLWQDQHKILHVESVDGKKILDRKINFFIYGIGINQKLDKWIAGSIEGNLYTCINDICRVHCYLDGEFPGNDKKYCGMTPDALSADKPINIGLTPDENYAISANYHHVLLWDLTQQKIIHDFKGNSGKTFATLSPDGKYMVSGDEEDMAFVFDIGTGKVIKGYNIWLGQDITTGKGDKDFYWDKHDMTVFPPKDFDIGNGESIVMSLKFIDNDHYLRFTQSVSYAILYQTTDPKPLKYLSLGRHPEPSLEYFERNQAIDTSPSAHVLVMGKENWGGILVYRYDPTTQTLKKVWDAS